MSCDACEIAQSRPTSAYFRSSCLECTARMLAAGPLAWDAMRGEPQALLAAIEKAWPDVNAGRRAVWAWIKRLDLQPPVE